MNWPINSPDLNPIEKIENVWSILKDKLKQKNPKNEK